MCAARRVQVKVRVGGKVMRDQGKRRDRGPRHPQDELVCSIDVVSMSIFALAQHCSHTVLARTEAEGDKRVNRPIETSKATFVIHAAKQNLPPLTTTKGVYSHSDKRGPFS